MAVKPNFFKKSVLVGSSLTVCVGVVFNTIFSNSSNNSHKYIQSYAKIMTGSTLSFIALLSLRGLLMSPGRITAKSSTRPLEHLKLLNYQPRSISAFTSTLPSYVHSRCV